MNQAIKDHLMTTTIADTALPLHLFTVEEYHRMAEAGLFEGQRVELIYGKIVDMSPSKSDHAGIVKRIHNIFREILDKNHIISVQDPIHIDDRSEPEPDIAILQYREDYYTQSHPTPKETLLVIEVANSSLEKDQKVKLPLYAKAGIPEVWIVNLQDHQLEQYREPSEQGYSSIRILRSKDSVENEVIGSLEVEKVLGK
jgi:Uma2 family endonuclease